MNRQLSPWPNSPSSTGEPRGFYGDPLNPIPNKSKDENEAIPSASNDEDRANRIRKLAWESFKKRGLTIFTADDEPDDTEAFCFYEQGFSDAFDHIFKTTEEIKKAIG